MTIYIYKIIGVILIVYIYIYSDYLEIQICFYFMTMFRIF